jgi:toxin ParE1/3/4
MTNVNRIKFSKEAVHEFRDSVEWYESKAEGLGLRFTDELDITVERIKLSFDLYPKVVEDIRKIQVNKFPYSIFYKIENDTLIILRVFHNKRKPLEW